MGERIRLGRIQDIPPGTGRAFDAPPERIAVFNVDGAFFAISDACPHAGGELSQGWVEGGRVICPFHGWTFELATSVHPPDDGICRYPVIVEGDDLYIEAP